MEEIIDMQMPVLLCAILLIVISIPLYFGKGSNMIAGYNDLSQVDKEKINKREKIIQIALKMGKQTGKIIEEYEKVYIQKTEKEELISEIQKQYNNICELVNQIDINIDDILNENIRKINSRYNEKGEKENNEQEK